ncbi:GNAT family N-acetyltransferase [Roseitranquillus sediminis]|uniref:GNAT family N-acetyltransferase n=1 Tax=Roseitranquillus sediminis TaxID=2809051 RepID=UPI001D0CAF3A|nr:GNAT family N-acetyltransferase [Roseitranquillus sediminis]MBM9593144.1 GNAT family N-acetyltransferase [Roseitranquillus sediminis]
MIDAGQEVDYVITWLEMTERPKWPWPQLPSGAPATLLPAARPPVWYFLALYDAVGRDFAWEDMFQRPQDELQAWLAHEDVTLHTLMRDGWPAGFFVLDARAGDVVDLAYFGLVPEVFGRGLGSFLLRTALLTSWSRPGVRAMTVNTCTLDHPRALGLYQRHGFSPVRRETRSRLLTRPIPEKEQC